MAPAHAECGAHADRAGPPPRIRWYVSDMTIPGGTAEHRAAGSTRPAVRIAIVIVSDKRTLATDESGPLASAAREGAAGLRRTVPDYFLSGADRDVVDPDARARRWCEWQADCLVAWLDSGGRSGADEDPHSGTATSDARAAALTPFFATANFEHALQARIHAP